MGRITGVEPSCAGSLQARCDGQDHWYRGPSWEGYLERGLQEQDLWTGAVKVKILLLEGCRHGQNPTTGRVPSLAGSLEGLRHGQDPWRGDVMGRIPGGATSWHGRVTSWTGSLEGSRHGQDPCRGDVLGRIPGGVTSWAGFLEG